MSVDACRLQAMDASIFDRLEVQLAGALRDDAKRLRRELGTADKVKLGEYLDSVRELERRLEQAETAERDEIEVPDAILRGGGRFQDRLALMYELIVLETMRRTKQLACPLGPYSIFRWTR